MNKKKEDEEEGVGKACEGLREAVERVAESKRRVSLGGERERGRENGTQEGENARSRLPHTCFLLPKHSLVYSRESQKKLYIFNPRYVCSCSLVSLSPSMSVC